MLLLAITVGCGRQTIDNSVSFEFDNYEDEDYTDVPDEVDTIKADYTISVDDINVGINFYDGYKPYVIAFRTSDGDALRCEAYFKSVSKSNAELWSMDDAKRDGLIYDYVYDLDNGILVFYVKETKKLQLMPITWDYEVEFENVGAYDLLWYDAAVAKLGWGGTYYTVDVYPYEEFTEDDIICAKKVYCEYYQHNTYGSNVRKNYMFVNKEVPLDYLEVDVE